jgi:outer membrane receptor protein involved in Fe transport
VQTLEDVPLSVSAVTGEAVNDYLGGGQDIRALGACVPGLNIETSNGRTQPRFYLRGLGNIDFDVNANQPVAMVFDEIPLENNVLRSIPLFDIERVEVLKGPQGSLFGRNTNAGAIKVDSVKPGQDRNGYFRATYGVRDSWSMEGASKLFMSDTFSMRASLKYQERGDWIDNFILQYSYPIASGELYFNTDWNYRDKSNLFLHRSVEFVQEERVLGGLRAGYRMDNGMDLALVGRNITDEVTVDGALNFLNLTAFVNEPAYWGVELLYTF